MICRATDANGRTMMFVEDLGNIGMDFREMLFRKRFRSAFGRENKMNI